MVALDKAVAPETELMVVPEGIPAPETGSPDVTVEAKDPDSGLLMSGEPLETDGVVGARSGPRLVSAPQSVIWLVP